MLTLNGNTGTTDVFALGAAFIIGWTQIKKHNELSSSYSLTAQEIGIIRGGIEEVVTEEQFSEYVSGVLKWHFLGSTLSG
ncbi:hypothetical protein [Vibrio harveyi]|uniref:hypothetical protein n=1 Tax=Vibrio harveyi TaxID=669 RepID=UPI0033901211